MTTLTTGVLRTVAYAKESSFGVMAGVTPSQYLRRVSAELNLTRPSYQSTEITTTAQTADMRLGMDKVEGTLKAELSSQSYDALFAALMRGPWVTGITVTTTDISVVAGAFEHTTGSFITDGFKVGDIITTTGFVAPANNGTFTVLSVTALAMTVDGVLTNVASGPSITMAVAGKKLVTPLTVAARTDDSFTFESWFSNLSISEVAVGVKVSTASINVQPNAMATVDFALIGQTMTQSTGAQYFTAPTAAPSTALLSGSKGSLYVAGAKVGTVTGFKVDINGNFSDGTAVGTRLSPALFQGRVTASGEMTVYFTDSTLFNDFLNESDISVVFRLDDTSASGNLFAIKLPRIHVSGTSKNDTETGGTIQTVPFTALLPAVSTVQDQSTVVFQEV